MKSRYKELCSIIDKHNRLYYAEGTPEISDRAYDRLYKELEDIEAAHPELVMLWSPTQRVGHASLSNDFDKTKHENPMLSLKNSYDENELKSWYENCKAELNDDPEVICEVKLDGLSIELIYENGCLIKAITRGDGKVGDDVTKNVMTIPSIPKILDRDHLASLFSGELSESDPWPRKLTVRGEIFMKFSDLEKANMVREANGDSIFVNARNAAAGILRSKHVFDTMKYNLSCFVFEINESSWEAHHDKHNFNMLWMKTAGLPVFDKYAVFSHVDDVFDPVGVWAKGKKHLDFPIDGLVYKLNSIPQRVLMGTRSKDPRWAIAYKFETEKVTTKLLDIINQVGRTGAITPVAVLEPVIIDGTTVRRASLHNYELVDEMDLCIGDIVEVEKAAEIIPQVVRVISTKEHHRKPEAPIECPLCFSLLKPEVLKGGVGGKNLICSGSHCPAKVGGVIKHFVSRDGMNIIGLGDKVVDVLLENDILTSVSGVFELKERREELESLPRFGKRKVDKLLSSIESSKNPSLENFIFSMGIPHVGKGTSRRLAETFKSAENFFSCGEIAHIESIEDIGELTARSIFDWLSAHGEFVLSLLINKFGIDVQTQEEIHPPSDGSEVHGKTFVATGKLSKGRKEVQADIQAAGGKIGSGVSKNTDFLVCGEKAGSKKKKAEKLGVKIITEDELNEMLKG